jgi:hypothetical protein
MVAEVDEKYSLHTIFMLTFLSQLLYTNIYWDRPPWSSD